VLEVGRLSLTGGAAISSITGGAGRAGTVQVTAADSIAISGYLRDATRSSQLSSLTEGRGEAGRIVISTPTLILADAGLISASTEGAGGAGDIVLEVGRLSLTGGAHIGSITAGTGPGGTVQVIATDSVVISDRSSFSSSTVGRGEAGHVTISAPTLTMDGGAITAGTLGDSRGGDIVVTVGRLTLTGGALITGTSCCAGPGGTVTVTATDSVVISGRASNGTPSHLSSAALGPGDAGRVALFAPTVILDGGTIETSTRRDGRAGDIVLGVGRLALTDGAQIDSRTRGVGRGGTVTVTATDIELSEGGTISASSAGQGAAGNIVIRAGQLFRSRNGAVTTQAETAGGGTIVLHAGRRVQLQDSAVTTSVRGGAADAGNLTLEAPFVVADGSQIVANAFGGRGGNILINAGVFLADPASLVSASSQLGLPGEVDIQAPVTSLSGTLAPLPQAFVNVAALLPARCAARLSGGQTSSLVLGGRDGLPAEPSGMLPSPLVLGERLVADPTVTGAPQRQKSAARFTLLTGHEQGLPRFGCSP
jgi:large exoprotein involved in heme utilization and adhesion